MERVKPEIRSEVNKTLNGLIGEAGDLTAFARAIDVKRDSVNNWLLGKSDIRLNDLVKISKKYGISVDNILGLSDYQSTDANVRAACEYTGLSEEAVAKLHDIHFDVQSKEFISLLITEYLGTFHNIYAYIAAAIESQRIINRINDTNTISTYPLKEDVKSKRLSTPDGYEKIPAKQALDFKLSESANLFRRLIEEYVKVTAQTPIQDAPNDGNGPRFNDTWGYGVTPGYGKRVKEEQ